jgi:hypothetical protein
MMHGREKSDSAIVAGKPTNKAVSFPKIISAHSDGAVRKALAWR